MKNILTSIVISTINSILFVIFFGLIVLLSVNNINIGPLGLIIFAVPYIIIYIYQKKYKLEPKTSMLGSLGTMLIMCGLSIIAWNYDKGDLADSDDSLVFSGYMFIYITWIFIPFLIKILIAKWKLRKGLQETEK